MGQKIVNNLENTITEGNYTGGNSTVNIYYNNQQKEDTKKSNGNKTIFLSYNWHDKEIADKIDKHLSGLPGITVKRDIRDIGPWKSIRKFMEGIRQQDYAVLIISGLYLKSKNCMFEVMEIMKEQQYRERIFPAVVEYGIYDPLTRAEYIKYWQHECDKLEASLKGLEPEYISGLAADLRQYKSIASSIEEFLNMVADMNNPDIQEVELQIEKAILKDR